MKRKLSNLHEHKIAKEKEAKHREFADIALDEMLEKVENQTAGRLSNRIIQDKLYEDL